jgi:LysM repeat protein
MRRQRSSALVLIAVPAVVSLLVTMLVLYFWDKQREPEYILLPTHSATSQVSPLEIPPTPADEAEETGSSGEAPPGQEPDAGQPPTEAATIAPDCENPVHVVESGETLGAIAEQYGVATGNITVMNQLVDPEFNPDFLNVGQELVIPVCGIPTPTPTLTATASLVPTRSVPSPIPTATNPPPGATAVRIARVLSPGDITKEAVEIVNEGAPVELEEWTLENEAGDAFEFPSFRLFSGGAVTIYTGVGQNTPIDLYWGLTRAIWAVGDTVFLFDDNGDLQHEFTITAE